MRARLSGYDGVRVRYPRFVARLPVGLCLALLTFAAGPALASEDGMTETELTGEGAAILSEHCARCHAIGMAGDSPNSEAPPFRTLSENYPVENLAESLAEGIVSGHPDMPEFVFKPHDVDAIIAYLQSIQASPAPAPSPTDSLAPTENQG